MDYLKTDEERAAEAAEASPSKAKTRKNRPAWHNGRCS